MCNAAIGVPGSDGRDQMNAHGQGVHSQPFQAVVLSLTRLSTTSQLALYVVPALLLETMPVNARMVCSF